MDKLIVMIKMSKKELTFKIPEELMKELDRVSGLLGWDVPSLARLTLEEYALSFESYMDDIAFGSYAEDKKRLENIFQNNPEILERLRLIHKRIDAAPDEDEKVEILACEYEQFYAELYKDYKEVRKLHKDPEYECCNCGKSISPDFLCQECQEESENKSK